MCCSFAFHLIVVAYSAELMINNAYTRTDQRADDPQTRRIVGPVAMQHDTGYFNNQPFPRYSWPSRRPYDAQVWF